jgi:hypothetical protein
MKDRYSIELDFAYDEDTVEEALLRVTAAYNGKLLPTVVDASGPGGGWPIVRWTTFDQATMVRMIEEYTQGTVEDAIALALGVEHERVL